MCTPRRTISNPINTVCLCPKIVTRDCHRFCVAIMCRKVAYNEDLRAPVPKPDFGLCSHYKNVCDISDL